MSVTAAAGFRATGLHCGVKPDGQPDLALITAGRRVPAAAVFTTSTTAAPTVALGREAIADGFLSEVVVVSGCANAGVGMPGKNAALRVVDRAAELLEAAPSDVLFSTTGPIGTLLPDQLVRQGLEQAVGLLGDDATCGEAAAAGILTTDTVAKQTLYQAEGYVIGGIAKGVGMARPDMATMLAYLTTDARLSPDALDAALRCAADATFNSLNIDGCQSTNDTAVVLASGESGVEPDVDSFTAHLTQACRDLAMQMVRDAEGGSRVVTLKITGASDDTAAREIGRVVADAALVRSSFYGADPNWGRLLAAAGVAGHPVNPDQVSIRYAGIEVARDGMAVSYDAPAVVNRLQGDFTVEMSVGTGGGTATILTVDLTPEYVIFNGEPS